MDEDEVQIETLDIGACLTGLTSSDMKCTLYGYPALLCFYFASWLPRHSSQPAASLVAGGKQGNPIWAQSGSMTTLPL